MEVEEAMAKTLIDSLTPFPVLALPDFDKLFFLTTYASDAAVGVILSQETENSKNHHINVCYSNPLTRMEVPSEQEGLHRMVG